MDKATGKHIVLIILIALIAVIVIGCSSWWDDNSSRPEKEVEPFEEIEGLEEEVKIELGELIATYENRSPEEWGTDVSGVVTGIETEEKVAALTLDACGGNDDYDQDLIEFLIREEVPATLFVNSRWIDDRPEVFRNLADNPLFTIANHGTQHLPLSVDGRSAYGIQGTENVKEVLKEVLVNEEKIQQITGNKPVYFRSGTAHYDEIAVEIINELGKKVIGFDVSGDGGAEFTAEQVQAAFLEAEPGSIILAHMNQPQGETAEGIMAAVPKLRERGFRFVKLDAYDNQL